MSAGDGKAGVPDPLPAAEDALVPRALPPGSPRGKVCLPEAVARTPSVPPGDGRSPASAPAADAALASPAPSTGAGAQAQGLTDPGALSAALAALVPTGRRRRTPAGREAEARAKRAQLLELIRRWRVEEGLGWDEIAARLREPGSQGSPK